MIMLSLQETKQCLLNILIAFDIFCEENNLKYYLCGGALIGAVRHKGFIPWDDDIDVLMPRPDYEKLFKIESKKRIGKNLELFSFKKGNSNLIFAKLGDISTYIYNQYQIEKECLSIDIFPLDGLSNSDYINKQNYLKMNIYKNIYALHLWRFGHGSSYKVRIIKSFCYPFAKLIKHSLICNIMESLATKYSFETADMVGDIIWGYGKKEIIKKEDFLPQIEVCFENKMFKTTAAFDEYLRQVYGNYMALPPEDKRKNHELVVFKKE